MPEVLFLGGLVDGRTMSVDTSKPVIVIPHPIQPLDFWEEPSPPTSVRIKTDRYHQRRRVTPDGMISVVYVYEGTDG